MAAAARADAGRGNPDAERQLARLVRRQADARIEGLFQNQLRRFGGDLFDLHAARRRRHEDRLALHAVEHDAQIQFALDGQRLFDQQPLHHAAFGPGLVGDQPHAQHLARDFGGFGGILGHFDSAALAASAGVDLRLHHHAAANAPGGRFGLFHRVRYLAARHRNVVLAQNGLGLILVNFHWSNCLC